MGCHEGVAQQLYDYGALFPGRKPYSERDTGRIGQVLDSGLEKGDLFYIQNLVAFLQAGINQD
jgi:hypothetical protein